jgi:SNF2 family DNA or RNA helicase
MGAKTLYPFQVEDVDFLLSRYHCGLLHEMGLGKTVTVCAAFAKANFKSSVIICPNPVKDQWLNELALWSVSGLSFIVKTGKDIIPAWADHIIVNFELARKVAMHSQIVARRYDAIVVDEVQRLKSMDSLTTQMIFGWGSKGSKHIPLIGRGWYKWVLSGTITPNGPIELFPVSRTLWPELIKPFTTFETFAREFCGGVGTRFDMSFYTPTKAALDNLAKRIDPAVSVRKMSDVYKDMPPIIESEVYMDVGTLWHPKQRDFQIDETNCPTATLRESIGLAKLTFVVDFVLDKLLDVDKLVVFAYHRRFIDELVSCLSDKGIETVKFYGGQSEAVRDEVKQKFKTGSSRVIVAQINAAGQGIDGFQYVCNHLLLAELDWVHGAIAQLIGRLRRIGQLLPVHVYKCIAQNTMNEAMMSVYYRKGKTLDYLWKDRKTMSLEATLERIAIALEKISGSGTQLGTVPTVEAPKAGRGRAAASAAPPPPPVGAPSGPVGIAPPPLAGSVPVAPPAAPAAAAPPAPPAAQPPDISWAQVQEAAMNLLDIYGGPSNPAGVAAIRANGAAPFQLASFGELEKHPQFWPQALYNFQSAFAQAQAAPAQVAAPNGLAGM